MYENFKYIVPAIEKEINGNVLSGAEIAVIHKGETVFKKNIGMADKENAIPMTDDTIFRLFSMTKPVTAVAAMILIERGMLDFNDQLKWYLPTFENPMVLDENGERPAERDITIRDLLSMTSGISYPDGHPSGQAVGALWGMQSENYLKGGKLLNTKEFALEMGKKPLAFTPGEKWMYGASADIMGAVIEVVSGMTLGEFFDKEIFTPLGMNDTGFYIPEEKYSRLAQAYEYADGGIRPFTHFHLCLTDYRKPPAFESGGAGLVSTLNDYSKFVKMLMNKGEYNGKRILGRKTVELMTKNYLNEQQLKSVDWDSMKGYGYGSFMRVHQNVTESGLCGSEGQFGWDGWMGCYFAIDPVEDMAMLYFIQFAGSGCTRTVKTLYNMIWSSLD